MTYTSSIFTDMFYPEDDVKRMAENTKSYRWIAIIKENLEILLANIEDWVSPRFHIRFSRINGALEIYRPNGRRLLIFAERY
ncbi:MAG: hypothetical protein LH631_03940 [Alkalinema sp. CAN_BIN05]|nr:hypothetical protein [Alkalinema sp. CAN_BIN05]